MYTRQQSILLHSIFIMQRSPHETDSTSYVHVSVIIIAQYFYYAKIPARDRFIPPVILTRVNGYYYTVFLTSSNLHASTEIIEHK